MLRDLALRNHASLIEAIPAPWRKPLLHLALGWAVLLVLLAPVAADMMRQFWDSSTYNHMLFVPLIIGWLVTMRWPELQKLEPRAFWPGLLPLGGALFLWLLGAISGTSLAEHLALVLALQSSVLLILGPRVVAGLVFPISYALFMVPFGDEMVPMLQMITADLTIMLVHWSGIPAEINGVFIDTPIGLFEVAEACSGVKFLIAMAALGSLAAHVCFRSNRRRLVFMALALVLPILANGVRAWGTIYIAQSQGVAFAAGFDHIFYGWVFFALVMAALLAASWRYFDRPRSDTFIDAAAIERSAMVNHLARFSAASGRCVIGLALMTASFAMWAQQARSIEAAMPAQIFLPEVSGWQRAEQPTDPWWEPRAAGADHRLLGSYIAADGARVDLFYALYRSQEDGREASGFGEGALMPDSHWSWHSPGPDFGGPDFGGGVSDRLQAGLATRRIALTYYHHRDLLTGSAARLKLSTLRDRLLVDPRPTSMIIVSAVEGGPVPAEEAMRRFMADGAGGDMAGWMDRIGQVR
jgi:exosortase A